MKLAHIIQPSTKVAAGISPVISLVPDVVVSTPDTNLVCPRNCVTGLCWAGSIASSVAYSQVNTVSESHILSTSHLLAVLRPLHKPLERQMVSTSRIEHPESHKLTSPGPE